MKKIIYAFITLPIIPSISLACTCGAWIPLDIEGKYFKNKYKNNSSIVLAKVERVDKILIPEIGSEGRTFKVKGEETVFSSIRTWKGNHGDVFHTRINTSPVSCGTKFELGETYLLFLNQSKKGSHYRTNACSGNLRLSQAQEYISNLDYFESVNNLKKIN